MRRVLKLALLLVTLAPAIGIAQRAPDGSNPVRVIVKLRDDVALAAFDGAYAPDARFADRKRFGYHSRSVVGAIMSLERKHGFRADAFFSAAIKGFAATMPASVAAKLAADPLVEYVEPDNPVQLVAPADTTQIVDWGITKIGADRSSTHSGDGAGTVSGVTVYVIDTGVDPTHPDINLIDQVTFAGDPNADCNGHGTGVAGIIGARDNDQFTVGVAPGVPVVGVKVLNCDGITLPSVIIQGVDWVTANAVKPAVANMSLGSLIPLTSVNTAVQNSAASGVFYALAAGNGNPYNNNAPLNACLTSPAGAGYNPGFPNGIVTVGATDQADAEAPFSNFGVCVDLWAPGVDVTAPWLMADGGTITASGTSFSSPYVAGAAALFVSRVPSSPPWFTELILELVADVPGTLSKDGRPIRRLQVERF